MFITCPSAYRSSKAVEEAVTQLVDMLKSPLTEAELKDMIPEPEENPNNEPDAYTLVLNCFTQKNTDALIKCKRASMRDIWVCLTHCLYSPSLWDVGTYPYILQFPSNLRCLF